MKGVLSFSSPSGTVIRKKTTEAALVAMAASVGQFEDCIWERVFVAEGSASLSASDTFLYVWLVLGVRVQLIGGRV